MEKKGKGKKETKRELSLIQQETENEREDNDKIID